METGSNQEEYQFEGLIQGLIDNKFGSCNNFIDLNTTTGLRSNIQSKHALGHMNPAGIGNASNLKKDIKIRGDKINWIEEDSSDQFEMIYLKKIERFITYLNKTCYTAISSFESHYAIYESKSFYKRHLDQFKNQKGRKYSIVLYLNENWEEEDGGMLSLYPIGASQINIYPMGGRMVFFKSDEMEHEVHPSMTRDRRSIACWLKN